MTNGNVVKITPDPEAKLIMGLIPCANRLYLGVAWPIIQPGVAELAQESLGEWDEWRVFREVYGGTMQLYMGYIDKTNTAQEDKFQEIFVEKLKTPETDYVGFLILQFLEKSAHIFAAYVMPAYRSSNVLAIGFKYIENEVRKMGAPYISLSTRPDVSGALQSLGFRAQYMTYRKKL